MDARGDKRHEASEQSLSAYPQVLPWKGRAALESRQGFKLTFVQNLVGPFARFNGALGVVNPKATPNPSDDSPWSVDVFDELNRKRKSRRRRGGGGLGYRYAERPRPLPAPEDCEVTILVHFWHGKPRRARKHAASGAAHHEPLANRSRTGS